MWRLYDHTAAIRRRDEVLAEVSAAAGMLTRWQRFYQWQALREQARLSVERTAHLRELTRAAKLRTWKVKQAMWGEDHRREER